MDAKELNPEKDTTDWENKIDHLVYELYGLTEEEIKIVEGVLIIMPDDYLNTLINIEYPLSKLTGKICRSFMDIIRV